MRFPTFVVSIRHLVKVRLLSILYRFFAVIFQRKASVTILFLFQRCISLTSFEVGEEVYEAFQKNGFDMPRISIRKEETGKHHIDLWEANRLQLLAFGVPPGQVELAQICTYIHYDDFFSARRLGIKSGRILSGIMIHE